MKKYYILLIIALFFLLMPEKALAATYYASSTGSGNTCSPSASCSLNTGLGRLAAGDTLYLRGGEYHQKFAVNSSGTEQQRITITAAIGELSIIDGSNATICGAMIDLNGDYITFSGLEIRNISATTWDCGGNAIYSHGSYNTISHMKIHHIWGDAILAGAGTNGGQCGTITNYGNIIEDNEVWEASLIHGYDNKEGASWGNVWGTTIAAARCPQGTIIRRNIIHDSWGIAFDAYEAYDTIIEDNIVRNNQLEHYYVSDAPNTVVQRNISYNEPGTIYTYHGSQGGTSFAFCDEKGKPDTQNVKFINNISWRGNRGFFFFKQLSTDGLRNFLIANNTFIDSTVAGIQFDTSGTHENSSVVNNIVSTASSIPLEIGGSGITFSHNLWSRTPPSGLSGMGDVIGNPLLVGGDYTKLQAYALRSGSPAINAGANLYLQGVTQDYSGNPRPQSGPFDLGAYEYQSGGSVTITPSSTPSSPTRTPTPPTCLLASSGDFNCDNLINESDLNTLLGKWMTNEKDITGDAIVNESDLNKLLGNWKI